MGEGHDNLVLSLSDVGKWSGKALALALACYPLFQITGDNPPSEFVASLIFNQYGTRSSNQRGSSEIQNRIIGRHQKSIPHQNHRTQNLAAFRGSKRTAQLFVRLRCPKFPQLAPSNNKPRFITNPFCCPPRQPRSETRRLP